jgi:hypothetical protein
MNEGPNLIISYNCRGCSYNNGNFCKKLTELLLLKTISVTDRSGNRTGSSEYSFNTPHENCPFIQIKKKEFFQSELTKFENEDIAGIEEIIREIFLHCYHDNNGIEEFTVIQENSIGIKEIELCKEKLSNYELRIVGNEDSNSVKIKLTRISKND